MSDRSEARRGRVSARVASLIVASGSIAVAISELTREGAIAAVFGTSRELDAFFGVWIIPAVVIGTGIYLGKLAVVPAVAARLHESRGSLTADLAQTSGWVMAAAAALGLLVAALAPLLVPVALPGLDSVHRHLAVQALRALAPHLSLGIICGYLMALLQADRHFRAAAFAAVLPNLMVAAAAIWMQHRGVLALGWAFSLGSLLQAIALWLALRGAGLAAWPRLRAPTEFSKGLLVLAAAPALLVVIRNLGPVVDRACASFLDPGALACLNYAYRLTVGVRVLITGTAFTVSIPFLATLHARGREREADGHVERSVRATVVILAPICAYLAVLGPQVVGLLLMRGAFGVAGATATGHVLAIMAQTLLPDTIFALLAAPYFARREPTTPLRVVLFIWPFHLLLVWPMTWWLGLLGIPSTGVIITVATALVMWRRMRRSRRAPLLSAAGRRDIQAALIGALAVGSLGFVAAALLPGLDAPFAARAAALSACSLALGAVYVVSLLLFSSRRGPRGLLELLRANTT